MKNTEQDGGVSACQRCGLRVVRRELEAKGIAFRFCPFCDWGELEEDAAGPAERVRKAGGKAAFPRHLTSPGRRRL